MLAFFFAAAFLWAAWVWWADQRYRTAMAEIRTEVATGRFAVAAADLVKVLAWKPNSDEAAYLLGTCEQARGRPREAGEAWARVVPGSEFARLAILAHMRLLQESGRLADAEQLVKDAAEDPRNDRMGLRVLLVPTYTEQGRRDEAERLIEARWEQLNAQGEGALEPAIKLAWTHIELTWMAIPVEALRAYFEKLNRLAPQDDRVWLGQANLAIRTGDYDAAERLLDACVKLRPEDVPVWRARLRGGIATNHADAVRGALARLPAALATPAEVHRLKAWLAAQGSQVETERRELVRLVAADPADRNAFDGLPN